MVQPCRLHVPPEGNSQAHRRGCYLSVSQSVIPQPKENKMKPTQSNPSIVFCHGIWADGSCFNKVIPTLQAEGYEVIAAQYGLDSQAADVAATKRTLGRVSSPAILVRHSYGGAVAPAPRRGDSACRQCSIP